MKRILPIILFFGLLLLNTNSFAQVKQEWVQRFTSEGENNEAVNDMFVDAQGNVYVTGSQKDGSYPNQTHIEAVTIKYNSEGVQQWIQNYHAPTDNGAFCRAIHVDNEGNVYVTGETAIYSGGANEMLVIKYNSAGEQQWANRFQYVQNVYTGGFDIITDLSHNVYVTGEYGNGGNNIFLVKYGPSGNLINQTFYNVSSEGGRKIGMDGAGKIIIGGYINDNDSLSFIALKYEQNLDFDWATRWGHGIGNQSVIDMVIDNNSNILLAGTSDLDYALLKINDNGVFQWGKTYNSPEGYDYCRAVVADNSGNIYVTGETGSLGFPTKSMMTTIKYNTNGDQQWIRNYNGGDNPDGYTGFNIAIDKNAGVYVTGVNYSKNDICTIKYNTSGTLQWAKTYNVPGNSNNRAVSVGVDANNNVFTSGNSYNTQLGTGYDIAIIKYVKQSTFTTQLKKNKLSKAISDNQYTHDTISLDYDEPLEYYVADVKVTLDSVIHSNISDLDFILSHNGISDTLLIHGEASGENFMGTILSDSAAASIASGTAPYTGTFKPYLFLSKFGYVKANGDWVLSIYDHSNGNTGHLDAWSLNFILTESSTGVHNLADTHFSSILLEQNYPNPFRGNTTIGFSVPKECFVNLTIYDINGKLIRNLANAVFKTGISSLEWNGKDNSGNQVGPGVYICQAKSADYSKSIRMVIH